MKLSLCITNHNRTDLLIQSFSQVLDDVRITEVVISDDCSDNAVWEQLKHAFAKKPKIRLYRNDHNLGMSLNKKRAIELARNEWAIIFDSDNIMQPAYLDALERVGELKEDTIYMPSAALPSFDYSKFKGMIVYKDNVKAWLLKSTSFNMALNTCNYVVSRERYLSVYEQNNSIKASDTIWFNFLWLKSNGRFYFVPDMTYSHKVHAGSGFMKDFAYNMVKLEDIKKQILALP